MAHNLTVKSNGKASMAIANGTAKPWWEGFQGLQGSTR